MTTLIISPEYISHYNPLSVVGRAASSRGDRVVVATGAALRDHVERDGFEWRDLALGPASNSGIIRADPAIGRFLAATERGPLATIRYQAMERQKDLLRQPERIATEIGDLLVGLDPTEVIVDHVSFVSTLAVYASGRPFVTLVPGHPTQLPVGAERYGVPPEWPTCLQPQSDELAMAETIADGVAARFTERWNEALAATGSDRRPVEDAYRVHGQRVLYNSSAALQAPYRRQFLPADHRFVGPLVRSEPSTGEYESWHERADGRPQVYVAFGTFLSRRCDVLSRITAGLRQLDVRAAIAIGSTSPDRLGPIPADWFLAPTLPQVELLAATDVAIHHGGNNSVQESMAAGCRQVVLPFSTDQFANAADLERRAGGTVLDPNRASASDVVVAVRSALNAAASDA